MVQVQLFFGSDLPSGGMSSSVAQLPNQSGSQRVGDDLHPTFLMYQEASATLPDVTAGQREVLQISWLLETLEKNLSWHFQVYVFWFWGVPIKKYRQVLVLDAEVWIPT